MQDGLRPVPPELVAEAKKRPGGWVYEIAWQGSPADAIPPDAIRGAWKVDDLGEITGEFVPNPRFDGTREGAAGQADHSRGRHM